MQIDVHSPDGNIFVALGHAVRLLKKTNQADKARELQNKVFDSHSYKESCALITEYTNGSIEFYDSQTDEVKE